MEVNVEEYLKKRLLIDDNQNISTKFDELVSIVQFLAKEKCKEQRMNCLFDLDVNYIDGSAGIESIKLDSIVNAKEPIL